MGSFAELIDYDKLFAEIEQKKKITVEQKEIIRNIGEKNAKRFGNPGIGTSLGATFMNCVYQALSFIQNLFTGFKMKEPMDSVSAAASKTGDKFDAFLADQTTMHIYTDMIHDPRVAEFAKDVSGQYPVSEANEIAAAPKFNIRSQISEARNISPTTKASLNRTHG